MGKVIPNSRWTKAKAYKEAGANKKRGSKWYALALVALPLGAFSAILFAPSLGDGPQAEAASFAPEKASAAASLVVDREEATFPLCSGRQRITCVVDGDTIWYRGEKIRLVGFDTPEISNPGCAREKRLGEEAKLRLQSWLNEGAFSLNSNPEGRSEDRYGRSLKVLSRDGENVGEMLLAKGLAEERGGWGNGWC
ncbi:MAG: thermonuclease family protein [Pseudomonadota bacterium]